MYEYGGSEKFHWLQSLTAYNWYYASALPQLIKITDCRGDGAYMNFTLKMEDVFFCESF
jgi:hypothetical protein